jgi:hypothetical protein
MKLNRLIVKVATLDDDSDDGFVEGSSAQRIDCVWDITVALWSVATRGEIHAESRLRRDVAVLNEARR